VIKIKPKDLKEFPSHIVWFGKLIKSNGKIIVDMTTKDGKETKAIDIPVSGPSDWRLKNYVGEEIAFSLREGSAYDVKSRKHKPTGKYYLDLVLQRLPLDIPER
jgi:hypothetical protein